MECLRLEGSSGDCLVQPTAQSRINQNRLSMAASCPIEFWVSARMGTLQLFWATCAIVLLSTQQKVFSYIYFFVVVFVWLGLVGFVCEESLSLSFYKSCSGSLIIFVALSWTHSHISLSFIYGKPRTGNSTPGAYLPELSRAEGLFFLFLMSKLFLMQFMRLLTFVTRVHCCLMFTLISASTPWSFSAKLLSN